MQKRTTTQYCNDHLFKSFTALRLLVAALFFLSPELMAEEDSSIACVFKRPFIFGASISAGYTDFSSAAEGGLRMIVNRATGLEFPLTRENSQDPVTTLVEKYRWFNTDSFSSWLKGEGNLPSSIGATNISELVNTMPFESQGHRQLISFINKEAPEHLQEKFDRTTLLVGLDAFYWPTIYSNWHFGHCSSVLNGVEMIQFYSKTNKIPLILGTVPVEDPNLVYRMFQGKSAVMFDRELPFDWPIDIWDAPNELCVNQLNSLIRQSCDNNEQCYLVDFAEVVRQLNSTGISFEGSLNKTYDFRFDGIHLSSKGNRYVQSLIEDELKKRKPLCASET